MFRSLLLSPVATSVNRRRTAAFAAGAVLLLCAAVAAILPGMKTSHMAAHILLMTGLAPLLAFAAFGGEGDDERRPAAIVVPTLAQLALFLVWHAPPGQALAMEGSWGLVMQASLAASAVWFWALVFRQARHAPVTAAAALLVTGKIFCLVAVLWVFAPRPLTGAISRAALEDQQTAGLIMLVACPAVYVSAATAIASLSIRKLVSLSPGAESGREGGVC